MSRQLVSHGHVLVGDKVVKSPSYQVQVGDLITLDTKAKKIPAVAVRMSDSKIVPPAWLERQAETGKVLSFPVRSQIDTPVNEQPIVEFYSR